ncbi:aldo/keto reductase [bacterium]|nr:MAG: aldo/keto reductase [bacterium]
MNLLKSLPVKHTDLIFSQIGYGCMNLANSWDSTPLSSDDYKKAATIIDTALEQGITVFDHADIYMHGKSEEVFSGIWENRSSLRQQLVLQSKCGIRFDNDPHPGDPKRYDFSYLHIMQSVERSLKRLKTDHLDVLLFHRPDALVEKEEFARACNELFLDGKVRYFGLSNCSASQFELLQDWTDEHLVINQVQVSLWHHHLITDGFFVDLKEYTGINDTLNYCQKNGILVQAWAPVAGGIFSKPLDQIEESKRAFVDVVQKMAWNKGVSADVIALAWLLRHPAEIQPIIGSTNPDRIRDSIKAADIQLTREEWYVLTTAAVGNLP